jgi:hypothetical protein
MSQNKRAVCIFIATVIAEILMSVGTIWLFRWYSCNVASDSCRIISDQTYLMGIVLSGFSAGSMMGILLLGRHYIDKTYAEG